MEIFMSGFCLNNFHIPPFSVSEEGEASRIRLIRDTRVPTPAAALIFVFMTVMQSENLCSNLSRWSSRPWQALNLDHFPPKKVWISFLCPPVSRTTRIYRSRVRRGETAPRDSSVYT